MSTPGFVDPNPYGQLLVDVMIELGIQNPYRRQIKHAFETAFFRYVEIYADAQPSRVAMAKMEADARHGWKCIFDKTQAELGIDEFSSPTGVW